MFSSCLGGKDSFVFSFSYFSPLTGDGVRVDAPNRPELSSGIVDFVAPAEYLVRPPMAPA